MIEARLVVALLDEFELQVAGVGQGDAGLDLPRLSAEFEVGDGDGREVEPRADPERDPVAHGRLDVGDDIAVLPRGPEDSTDFTTPSFS